MSTYYYFLRIYVPKKVGIKDVTDILNIAPTKSYNQLWEYKLVENEGDKHIDFISSFLDILSNVNIDALEKIGIEKQAISIWLNYEYDSQCNLEISSENMRKMGDVGLSLCISCWQK